MDISYRPFRQADAAPCARLSAGLGWPHRLADWQLAAELGEGIVAHRRGDMVGVGMTWRFGPDDATLGLMIVHPDVQGMGIGKRIMSDLLAEVGAGRIRLNATAAGLPLYEKLGFRPIGVVRQHQGEHHLTAAGAGAGIRPLTEADLQAVSDLDRGATGLPRARLLASLFRRGRGVVLEQGGGLAGYAFCRPSGAGHTIGPVVAADVGAARSLVTALLARTPGFVRIDLETGGGALGPFLAGAGLPEVGEVAAMARPGARPDPGGRINFALASQALG